MSISGTQWLKDLEDKTLMYNPAETGADLKETNLENYEETAQAVAQDLIETRIPSGIASCISRGSDRLGLPVPFKFLSSRAFQQVKNWAKAQGLILSVGWLKDVDIDSADKFCLNISPGKGTMETDMSQFSKAS